MENRYECPESDDKAYEIAAQQAQEAQAVEQTKQKPKYIYQDGVASPTQYGTYYLWSFI